MTTPQQTDNQPCLWWASIELQDSGRPARPESVKRLAEAHGLELDEAGSEPESGCWLLQLPAKVERRLRRDGDIEWLVDGLVVLAELGDE